MDELDYYLQTTSYYNYKKLKRILNKKIIITANHIKYVNIKEINKIIDLFEKYGYVFTTEDYIMLLLKDVTVLEHIPENKRTDEIYEIVARQNWLVMALYTHEITDKIYEIGIRHDGLTLQYIPRDRITNNMCKLAIRQNCCSIRYVPEDMKKYEICKEICRDIYNEVSKKINIETGSIYIHNQYTQ